MSEVDALEKVLKDNRSPDELQQLQENATTGGPRPTQSGQQQSRFRQGAQQRNQGPGGNDNLELERIQTGTRRLRNQLQQGVDPQSLVQQVRESPNLTENEKDAMIASIPELRDADQQIPNQ